jgi:putative ABC transport system substrate-binding protein
MKRRDFIALAVGATAAASNIVRAQQSRRIAKVGYLWHAGSAREEQPYFGALQDGFARLGYVDGKNISFEHRFPNEVPARFKSMAEELVALNPDVLMGGSISSAYLKSSTARIPIVFMFIPDPVGMKLVETLARPGGNVTGLSNFGRDIAGKRLQLLKDTVPGLSRVAMLVNSNQQTAQAYVDVTRAAALDLGLFFQAFDARSIDELEPAFDAMVKARMQAVVLAQGGTAFQWRAVFPRIALERRLALCAFSRETFEHGALLSYGPDQVEMIRRSAVFADKIIKGAKPSDIPVEQPANFELFINLQTAKRLGVVIPQSVLIRATEVIAPNP